jgi:hypothetical protein
VACVMTGGEMVLALSVVFCLATCGSWSAAVDEADDCEYDGELTGRQAGQVERNVHR